MAAELISILRTWSWLDTWIVVTSALAAMACAVPGVFLVVRRQSMMGDALSHTVLPGIVGAYLITAWLENAGWMSEETGAGLGHAAMLIGALAVGVVAAVVTEWVQKTGQVEASAALGVVFTSFFACGLLLIRLAADRVHIDPDCVLYGMIETVVLDTVGTTNVPRAACVNGVVLAVNLLLLTLFFKELQISAFDPGLSTSLGIPAGLLHYGLMAVTAATVVAAFESVGSILVIATLIVPAATAHLLTDRLPSMIAVSLAVAALSAVLGHLLAITVPPILFSRLGFTGVWDASTAGMTAVASGLLLVAAALFGPRHGRISRLLDQFRLRLQIAAEDVLGALFRLEEDPGREPARAVSGIPPALRRWALWRLARQGDVARIGQSWQLTEKGRRRALGIVRSHRLWESYVSQHFALPEDHLHASAERAEHFIDPTTREKLALELQRPGQDPHGRAIPADGSAPGP